MRDPVVSWRVPGLVFSGGGHSFSLSFFFFLSVRRFQEEVQAISARYAEAAQKVGCQNLVSLRVFVFSHFFPSPLFLFSFFLFSFLFVSLEPITQRWQK